MNVESLGRRRSYVLEAGPWGEGGGPFPIQLFYPSLSPCTLPDPEIDVGLPSSLKELGVGS